LAKNTAVQAALARLGSPHRLGSGKNYESDAAERLARIDRIVRSNVVNIYRDDGHARISTIVNGATPVTFSLRHGEGPTHLPHSLAASLNLLTDNAPVTSYTVGGRKLACRRVKVASIVVGGLELRNVEALALPPEGEDLGAKLGRAAYGGHYFDVDFSRLRTTIMPGEPPRTSAGEDASGKSGSKSSRTAPMSRLSPSRRSGSR
jgi:hypothetical protein